MPQYIDNSDYAATFTAAYEAGLEDTQRAPFRTPASISRRRPRRRSKPITKIGFFEGIDRKEATNLVRVEAFRDEFYGTPTSPEDALIEMLDGIVEPVLETSLLGEQSSVDNEYHSLCVEDLKVNLNSITWIQEMNHRARYAAIEQGSIEAYEYRCFSDRPFDKGVEPTDSEDSKEVAETNREFKRSQKRQATISKARQYMLRKVYLSRPKIYDQINGIDLINYFYFLGIPREEIKAAKVVKQKKRYTPKGIRTRESIRHGRWEEQLPWCGEEYLEHTFYGYTDAELNEDSEEEADLRSELAQWEMNLEFGEINQAFDYREEALQKLEDEAYALRDHRKNFIRDYDHMVRCSNIALQRAMASYDLELTVIADQRDTFDLDPLLNLDDSQLAAE